MDKIKILQRKIKIDFKNEKILLQAITHKSFDPNNNYENLEFLGDRVLGLVVSKKLFEIFPNEKVGSLDKKLASLVNKNKCLEVGNLLNLKEFVITGNSKSSRNIVENKIISDCCEAIIGAIYLDRGFEVSKIFILKQWKNLINNSEITFVDAKTRLQEYSLKNFKILPIYKLVSNTGPRHKPKFKVGVKLKNSTYVYAIGSSKKIAEQSAASELLKKINQQ
jgi:ribonuclease-3|tara:strand:+ start:369 stop:1034 length:666 start_codon:yes stop_codon:yes gene_type:complete